MPIEHLLLVRNYAIRGHIHYTKIFESWISGRKSVIPSFSTFLFLYSPVYNSGKCLYKIGHVFVCVYVIEGKDVFLQIIGPFKKKTSNWGSWITHITHDTLSLLVHSNRLFCFSLPPYLPMFVLPFHPPSFLHLFFPFFIS